MKALFCFSGRSFPRPKAGESVAALDYVLDVVLYFAVFSVKHPQMLPSTATNVTLHCQLIGIH